jgi:hypothetical protein
LETLSVKSIILRKKALPGHTTIQAKFNKPIKVEVNEVLFPFSYEHFLTQLWFYQSFPQEADILI